MAASFCKTSRCDEFYRKFLQQYFNIINELIFAYCNLMKLVYAGTDPFIQLLRLINNLIPISIRLLDGLLPV